MLIRNMLLLGLVRIRAAACIRITEVFPTVTIPEERNDEPHEKQERNYDRHDHVADLIAQVHEHRNDVERFCQRKDANQSFKCKDQRFIRVLPFVNIIDRQAKAQFNDRDH